MLEPNLPTKPQRPAETARPTREGQAVRTSGGLAGLFAVTTFLGAFLLFQVEPMIAKFILPWFGGGPGVWTICLLFFQIALLAGYACAHAMTRFFPGRTQAVTQAVLLAAALFFLPIAPGPQWRPGAETNPTWHILLLLTVCLGLPYLVLSTTGPLLQAWFSRVQPGRSPYRLYALSNAGSLLALVSYPFAVEPMLTRRMQAELWSGGFSVFVLLCGACGFQLWQRGKETVPSEKSSGAGEPEGRPATFGDKAWWFGMPACGSILLLATTNKLCLDMPSIPFLWVVPLSLYLLTFIICFDRPAWYARKFFIPLLVPLLCLLAYALFKGYAMSLLWQIIIYGSNLFVGCMICHGETYRLKPAPRFLTGFYLLVAAGGAAGGLFVGILSPLIFDSYVELNWGFWALGVLVFGICVREKLEVRLGGQYHRAWPAALIGSVILGGTLFYQAVRAGRDAVSTTRNFYGVLRVVEGNPDSSYHAFKLVHGGITHGLQFVEPEWATLATTYFNKPSGVGLVLENFRRETNRCVGVVGLGTGTLAAYGQRGDVYRFYEINPEVRRLAETGFSFVKNSAATVEVVPGDARLSLEREQPQQFDVLVLDAFSSDAIPVHLLTREAFEIYFRHLKPDGVIAVHISNRHLNLLPPIIGVAKYFHTMIRSINWDEKDKPWWFSSSRWVILSRNQPFMLSPAMAEHASIMPDTDAARAVLWTDDYASVLPFVEFSK